MSTNSTQAGPDFPESNEIRRFWQNPQVEQVLLRLDVDTCLAHIKMLAQTGIVSPADASLIEGGLKAIASELEAGSFKLEASDMDIHAGIERHLRNLIGDAALKLRIAKSRNDQIATVVRLWLREAIAESMVELNQLRQQLIELASRDLDVIMPGYTHMQPAMPILLAHWWLANECRFRRDFRRLLSVFKGMNALPLGACALAGTREPIDRSFVAKELHFDEVMENSLDAVSDRDYIVEFAAAAALIGTHLSQMSSELLLWATQEFGFIRLRKNFVLRSLTMPQKRNPELLEILRSRPSTFNGRLLEFLTQLKALPLGYCQDLQECLPGLMDLVENLKFVLELCGVLLPAIDTNPQRMKEMAAEDLTNASNAVDFLVLQDVPQDRALRIVEAVVHYCRQRKKSLADLTLSEWQQFSPAFDGGIYKHVIIDETLHSISSFGGTSQHQVALALERARQSLELDRSLTPVPRRQQPAKMSRGGS